LQEGAIENESIVTAVDCSSIIETTGIDTTGLQCVNVLPNFTASVSTGFNVADIIEMIEQSIQTGEFARMLFQNNIQGSGILFTVILPPSMRPSSFLSSSPSTSIADPSSVPTIKPSTTKSQKKKGK
jgi:hypothetical protein